MFRSLRAGSVCAPVIFVALLLAAPAHAQDAAPEFVGLPYLDGFTLKADQDPVGAKLAYAIQRAGMLKSAAGTTLLPAGAKLDRYSIDSGRILHIAISLPPSSKFGPLDVRHAAAIDHLLNLPFSDEPLGGTDLLVGIGSDGYRPLAEFLIREPAFAPTARQGGGLDLPLTAEPLKLDSGGGKAAMLGGPLANADGQPQGALSGVVIFTSAGHGWTQVPLPAKWDTQRPLLLEMVEDYGNLDQLNMFVQYAYNAGAIVVPFRPVGHQSIEIVLDNDDAGVTWTGAWFDSAGSEYYENGATSSGVPYRYANAELVETASARYTPTISVADFYPVYAWTADGSNRVEQTYRIHHSGGIAAVTIDHRRVGRGWIWLGNYYFEAGTGGYVEITNQSTVSGVVVADAIRFGNGVGDIVGGYTGTLSGFTREEEASRYWAQSEAGNNAVGLPSSIWNGSGDDVSDNTGTAARWAAYMNNQDVNNERWRRIYLEFHTNAAGCGTPICTARGTTALYNNTEATLNQYAYALLLGEKLEADLLAISSELEFPWAARNPNTYSASFAYGAISTGNNNDEFDATIIEIAFHDSEEDAALLRSVKVREAVARSMVQGIVSFLSNPSRFPGTQVPAVFLPDAPQRPQATHDGSGNVVVSWLAPPSRPAYPASGDPPTGYRIYRSSNGYGFGQAVDVGNTLSAILTDIPADTTVYLRVAAYNLGGESMPTETLAVRRPAAGPASVLIVNGFDRIGKEINYRQTNSLGSFDRQIPRKTNSFDYVVQHAAALAAGNYTFDSCGHAAILGGGLSLTPYSAVVWNLGRESTGDKTFDPAEQSLLTSYLNSGGRLLASGVDIGRDLQLAGGGAAFYNDTLGSYCLGNDANSYSLVPSGGCLAGMSAFNIDVAQGAPYPPIAPDRMVPRPGATNMLSWSYPGSLGEGAGIQYDSGTYRTIVLGFPFECITSAPIRDELMTRAMGWLLGAPETGCRASRLADFEGYSNGAGVMFRPPRYSTTTMGHLSSRNNIATVASDVAAFDGIKSLKLNWRYIDATPQRWMQLVTTDTPNVPNPTIDLRRAVRLRLLAQSPAGGSFRLSLGIRETGVDVPIGADGGTTGAVEWIGATTVVSGAPQGVLVTVQPGVWQTITFMPRPQPAISCSGGDDYLDTPNHKAVLDHLAVSITDNMGPFIVYLDGIEQPCSPLADMDGDGDVDIEDFGRFQRCFSGPDVPQEEPDCVNARLDPGTDVDSEDYAIFQNCLSGPDGAADPDCGG